MENPLDVKTMLWQELASAKQRLQTLLTESPSVEETLIRITNYYVKHLLHTMCYICCQCKSYFHLCLRQKSREKCTEIDKTLLSFPRQGTCAGTCQSYRFVCHHFLCTVNQVSTDVTHFCVVTSLVSELDHDYFWGG